MPEMIGCNNRTDLWATLDQPDNEISNFTRFYVTCDRSRNKLHQIIMHCMTNLTDLTVYHIISIKADYALQLIINSMLHIWQIGSERLKYQTNLYCAILTNLVTFHDVIIILKLLYKATSRSSIALWSFGNDCDITFIFKMYWHITLKFSPLKWLEESHDVLERRLRQWRQHSIPCCYCVCYILKHLKDKKLWSVHIYYTVMTSFSFSNCTEELSFASFFYTQFENSNDVISM